MVPTEAGAATSADADDDFRDSVGDGGLRGAVNRPEFRAAARFAFASRRW